MKTPCNKFPSLRDAIDVGRTPPPGYLIGAEHRLPLGDLLHGSAIACGVENLRGRSVLIASTDPFLTALALIELDGLARRMILYPPDLALEHFPYVMCYAEVDAVVSDGHFLGNASIGAAQHALCKPALVPRVHASQERIPTEWILLTSGTTGRPKMVLHTLASLTRAIGGARGEGREARGEGREASNEGRGARDGGGEIGESLPPSPLAPPPSPLIARPSPLAPRPSVWSTFYDIRRYGGLQIYLRAALSRSTLVLTGQHEPVANFLQRAGEAGVTHISGTPSHWRRALMSPAASRIAPRYIRLSGEIADQGILNSLRSFYPDAAISHAFATTEAGVAFDVRDELSGFPAGMLTGTAGVDLKVVDATLRVRSSRTAQRYLGENPPALKDAEGFVDTGDVLELRNGRYHFQGRRDGVINVGGFKVHPEEVEAVLNRHPQVRLSLVKTKKNPITGALVVAEVLLKDPSAADGEQTRVLQQNIKQFCRESLAPHKVPTAIRFVSALAISETGKLVRHHA